MSERASLRRLSESVAPSDTASEGDLRVWWIPQVPMSPFFVAVKSATEGWRLTDTLAAYDAFQFMNRIKPDYCNAGGLARFEDGEWCDVDEEDEEIGREAERTRVVGLI